MSEPRLVQEKIGNQWLITSPDVPGLYVVHADLERAMESVPSAIKMLQDMEKRRAVRELMDRRFAAA